MLSKIVVFNRIYTSGADHLALWSTATFPPSPEAGVPELRLVEGFAYLQASCGNVYGNFSTKVHKSLWGARLELEQADESLDKQARMNLQYISFDFNYHRSTMQSKSYMKPWNRNCAPQEGLQNLTT